MNGPLCECCLKPATRNCSGLDVPLLWFCDACAAEHEKNCSDIKRGAAKITYPRRNS